MEDKHIQLLNFALIFVIILLGLIGNFMSFVVFCKGRQCRALACSIYFRCLAIADSFVLLLPGLQLLIFLPPISIPYNNMNDFFCKLSTFNVVFGAQVSAWIIVMVTFERTLTICRPLQFRVDSSFFRPYMKVASIVLIFAASNCFYLVDNKMQEFIIDESNSTTADTTTANTTTERNTTERTEPWDNTTSPTDTLGIAANDDSVSTTWLCYPGDPIMSNVYTIISIGVFSFVIPLVINLTCNIVILYLLKNRLKDCSKGDGGATGASTRQNNLKNLIYRVFAISFVHCISTGPVAVLIFIDYRLLPSYVVRLFNTLYYVNSGVNFILYSVSGRDFRQDLVELFASKRRSNKPSLPYKVT